MTPVDRLVAAEATDAEQALFQNQAVMCVALMVAKI